MKRTSLPRVPAARPFHLALCAHVLALLFVSGAQAATNTWVGGTSGTWDLVTPNWNNGSTNVPWTNGNIAAFAGSDGSYAITLGTAASGPNLWVSNSGYVLSAASPQSLTLTLDSGSFGSTNKPSPASSALWVAPGKTFTVGTNTTVYMNGGNTGFSTTAFIGGAGTTGTVLNIDAGGALIRTNGATGVLRFSGTGTVNVAGTVAFTSAGSGGVMLNAYTNEQVVVNVNSGGLITSAGTGGNQSTWGAIVINNADAASSTVNVNSGATVSATYTTNSSGGIMLSRGTSGTGTGTININGGTVITPRFAITLGSGVVNLNGGTLRANMNNATNFLPNSNSISVNVNTNSTFDNGGFGVTVQKGLAGAAGLTFSGTGTTTLAGTNTYSGTTAVNAGTLSVSGALASAVTVSSNATFNLTGSMNKLVTVGGGTFNLAGTLTNSVTVNGGSVNGNGTATGTVTLNSGASARADVSGAYVKANGVDITGPVAVTFINGAPNNGQFYTLYGYGTGAVTGITNLYAPYRLTVADDTTNKVILVSATTTNLVWSTGSGDWTNGGGTNWGGGAAFYAGDGVTFTNSPSPATVTVSGAVLPGSVLFDMDTAYVLAGSGSVGGGGSITKSGAGTLSINNANSYTGGTTLNAGGLNINNASALGTGGLTVLGGVIDTTAGPLTMASPLAQTYAGDFAYGSGSLNFNGGTATVTGAGTRAISLGGGTITVGRLVSSNNAVTIAGAGTYALSANTGTGTNSSSVIGGNLTVTNGALLQMNTAGGGDLLVLGSLVGNGTISNTGTARWLFLSNNVANTFSGSIAGTAGLNIMAGSGTQTLSGANTYSDTTTLVSGNLVIAGTNTGGGALNISGGRMTVSPGGSFSANGAVTVSGTTANGTAILNFSAGTLSPTAANFLVGNSGTSTNAIVSQSGGTVSVPIGYNFTVGGGTAVYARYNMSGGTLTQNSTTADKVFRIGQSTGPNAVAIFDVSGGTVSSSTGFQINDANGGTGSGGYASMIVTGGVVSNSAAGVSLGIAGRAGTADVTVGGTGLVSAGQTSLGYSVRTASAGDGLRTGLLNLGTGSAGGTLQTGSVGASTGGTNSAYLSFNGGTLKALADSTTFLEGLTAATVYAAGGAIDNGAKSITVAQALNAPAGGSVTNFTFFGGGYTAPPYVSISGGGGAGASAVAQIDGSGNLTNIVITSPGSGYTTAPTVTFVGGGGSSYATASIGAVASGGMSFLGAGTTTLAGASTYTNATTVSAGTVMLSGSLAGNVIAASGGSFGGAYGTIAGSITYASNSAVTADIAGGYVTASNGVAIAGPAQVLFNGIPANGVTYTLFNYGAGGVTGTENLSSPYRLVISNDTGLQSVTATATTADIVWSTGNGVWTNAGGTNWSGGGVFYAGDGVTFTNSPSDATVTIQGSVMPGSIVFDSGTSYVFGGSGSIGGATSLAKSGTGTLTLTTSNSFSGGITLNAGQLNIDNPHALGSGALTINGGAIDNTSGAPLTLSTSNAQAWDGDFAFVGSNDLNMAPGAVTVGGFGDRTVTLGGGKTLTVGKITALGGLTLAGNGTLTIVPPAAQPGGDSSISGTLNVGSGATLRFNTGTNAATTADLRATGLSGGGTIVNGGGVERWLLVTDAVGTTFSGSLQDGGIGALGFAKYGVATNILAGSNSMSGRFTAGGAGMLVLAGPNASTNYGEAYIDASSTLVLAHTNALGATRMIRFNGSSSALVLATDAAGKENYLTMPSGTTATIVSDRATPGAGVTHYVGGNLTNNGLGTGTLNIVAGTNVTGGSPRIAFTQLSMGAGADGVTTLNPTTAGATISNAWKANNNVSQTLGLGGTNTENYVTGTIANGPVLSNGNSVSVAKSDTGTWYLTGSNTYSGTTIVNGGYLFINGNNGAASNTVTVNSGNLGGSGSLGGSLVLNGGSLVPGATATNIGTLTVGGSLTLGASATATFGVAGNGNNDSIAAVAGSSLHGTVIVEFAPSYTPASGDTFDFIAGAISGTPTLSLPALSNSLGWITNDFATTGVLTITNTNTAPTNAYAVWLTNYPGVGTYTNMTDDPDGDGFDNGKEFSFDGNPTAGTGALFKTAKVGTNVVFSFVANNSAFPTNYVVQSSANVTNAVSWTNNAAVTATITNAADQSGVLLTNDYTRKEFTVPVSGTEYFRVRAVMP